MPRQAADGHLKSCDQGQEGDQTDRQQKQRTDQATARQDGEPAPVVRAVPWLPEAPGASAGPVGAETGEILRDLGVDLDRFDDLRRRGIVGGGP